MRRTGCDPAPSVPSPRILWRTTGPMPCATVSSACSDSTPCLAAPPERSSAASHGSRPRAGPSPPSSATRDVPSTGRRSRTGCVDAVPAEMQDLSLPRDRPSRPVRRPLRPRRCPPRATLSPPRQRRARPRRRRRRPLERSSRPESHRFLLRCPRRTPRRLPHRSPSRPPRRRWRSRSRQAVRRTSRRPNLRHGRQTPRPTGRRRGPPPWTIREPRRRRRWRPARRP